MREQGSFTKETQLSPSFNLLRPFREKVGQLLDCVKVGVIVGVVAGVSMGVGGAYIGVYIADSFPALNPAQAIGESVFKMGLVGAVAGFAVGFFERHKQLKKVRFP